MSNNTNTIFSDRGFSNHADLLYEMIQKEKAGDAMLPVTIVGPSIYANISLRQQIAKKQGISNVRFIVLPRLAELIGAPHLASQGQRPLTGVLESAAIRVSSKINEETNRLASLSSHPSTHQLLKQSFHQLRNVSNNTLQKLEENSENTLCSQLLSLYHHFDVLTNNYYSAEDLAHASADLIKNNRIADAILNDLGYVIFFHIRDISPAQRKMIDAFSQSGRRCDVRLFFTGDQNADLPVENLKKMLGESFKNTERIYDDSGYKQDINLFIAPDPHLEIRTIIKLIMQKASEGTPFHRISVLYRKHEPYATLIREEFEMAGIPVTGPSTSNLIDTAVGRTLTGLMDLSDGKFKRDSVMSWLTSCPIKPHKEIRDRFNPSRWDLISKKANIVRGSEQWKINLERFADNEEQRAKVSLERDDISETSINAMQSNAEYAHALRVFFEHLEKDVKHPTNGNTWEEFCRWAIRLLRNYFDSSSEFSSIESNIFDTVEKILEEMKVAQTIEENPDFDTFRLALNESLMRTVGHIGKTGAGVFVGQIKDAVGMNFDTTYIVGMIEGAFPPQIAEDTLIPDNTRESIGGYESGFPTRRSRRADERHDFLYAINSSPAVTMSFSKGDPVTGQGQYASRWFLEQASNLQDSPVYTSMLSSISDDVEWLNKIESLESMLINSTDEGIAFAADIDEYVLQRLLRWGRAGNDIRDHDFVISSDFARTIELQRNRYGNRLTEWDGNLAKISDSFTNQFNGKLLSPTSIERWASCPFSYLLGYIFKLASVEKPEDIYSMRPIDKGNLVHRILERFIQKISNDHQLPKPTESWNGSHLNIMRNIAEYEFSVEENNGRTGKPLFWRLDKEDILNDLYSFLERDSAQRQRFGVSPKYVEARFGLDEKSWDQAVFTLADGRDINFKGIIDRVDVSADGSRALILDYKTGSNYPYSKLSRDPIANGRRLQLAIYSLAAQAAMGENVAVEAAYWFVTAKGGMSLVPDGRVNIAIAETNKRFGEGISTIVSGIESGMFPANPGNKGWMGFENCLYCDFDSLCPSRRNVLWNQKKSEPLLEDYINLSEN